MWGQLKYPDEGSDILFSTWREAQLMIAEVSGGQTAVGIVEGGCGWCYFCKEPSWGTYLSTCCCSGDYGRVTGGEGGWRRS